MSPSTSSATSRTLWDSTHHDFHPQPTTYDELWTKSRDLAAAVKDADPGAATLGPAEWGWPNYFCSAADHVDQGCFPTSPDRAAHGGTDLSTWYLQQFAALPAADRPPAARLLRPALLPAGPVLPRHRRDPLALGPDLHRPLVDQREDRAAPADARLGARRLPRHQARASASTTSASASPPTRGCRTSSRPTRSASSAAKGSTSRRSGPTAARRSPRRRSGSSATTTASTTVSATAVSRRRSSDQRRVSVYAARVGQRGPLTIVVVNKSTTAAADRGQAQARTRGATRRRPGSTPAPASAGSAASGSATTPSGSASPRRRSP